MLLLAVVSAKKITIVNNCEKRFMIMRGKFYKNREVSCGRTITLQRGEKITLDAWDYDKDIVFFKTSMMFIWPPGFSSPSSYDLRINGYTEDIINYHDDIGGRCALFDKTGNAEYYKIVKGTVVLNICANNGKITETVFPPVYEDRGDMNTEIVNMCMNKFYMARIRFLGDNRVYCNKISKVWKKKEGYHPFISFDNSKDHVIIRGEIAGIPKEFKYVSKLSVAMTGKKDAYGGFCHDNLKSGDAKIYKVREGTSVFKFC